MDATIMWILGVLIAACSGGYVYLQNRQDVTKKELEDSIAKNKDIIDALGLKVDSSKIEKLEIKQALNDREKEFAILEKAVESRPDFKYVNDEFYRKEMAKLQFENIASDFNEIKGDYKLIREAIQKLSDKISANHSS